jgi:cell division protein FtsA
MEEIIDQVYFEIKNSGFEKKLIGGVVLTGGGSELKHIDQLAEFMIGKDTRIGYPNEHLANDVPDEMASPMYATGVGLVIEGIKRTANGNLIDWDDDSEGYEDRRTKKKKKKKMKNPDDFGSKRFLDKLQEWFQSDTEG